MSTATAAAETLGIRVSDATGQKAFRAPAVPKDVSVQQMVQALIRKSGIGQTTDADGQPVPFRARLKRQSRFLNGSERVGDCLEPDDEIVLAPDIQAG